MFFVFVIFTVYLLFIQFTNVSISAAKPQLANQMLARENKIVFVIVLLRHQDEDFILLIKIERTSQSFQRS